VVEFHLACIRRLMPMQNGYCITPGSYTAVMYRHLPPSPLSTLSLNTLTISSLSPSPHPTLPPSLPYIGYPARNGVPEVDARTYGKVMEAMEMHGEGFKAIADAVGRLSPP